MKRYIDTRALIFYVMALVCLLLLGPCPNEFHHVGITLVVAYAVLGTFSWLDAIVRAGSGKRK
jgi:hypothetical protein